MYLPLNLERHQRNRYCRRSYVHAYIMFAVTCTSVNVRREQFDKKISNGR